MFSNHFSPNAARICRGRLRRQLARLNGPLQLAADCLHCGMGGPRSPVPQTVFHERPAPATFCRFRRFKSSPLATSFAWRYSICYTASTFSLLQCAARQHRRRIAATGQRLQRQPILLRGQFGGARVAVGLVDGDHVHQFEQAALDPLQFVAGPGSIRARKQSVMSATIVSDWPTPTVSISTTS